MHVIGGGGYMHVCANKVPSHGKQSFSKNSTLLTLLYTLTRENTLRESALERRL
jgi:hypothetical protein